MQAAEGFDELVNTWMAIHESQESMRHKTKSDDNVHENNMTWAMLEREITYKRNNMNGYREQPTAHAPAQKQ